MQKATAAWRAVARDLDARVARMLPCDLKSQQAIEETSRASQARLIALGNYYQPAAAIAATRTEGAKQLLAREQARSSSAADFLNEAKVVLAAAEQQAADLEASAQGQSALGGALAALRQAVETTRQRANIGREQETRFQPMIAALTRLVQAYEIRETALNGAIKAFDAERLRWNSYYAARLARAQLECSVTNPAAAAANASPLSPKPPPTKPAAKSLKSKAKAKQSVTGSSK